MADDVTPPLPGWAYTDGVGYTRDLGPLHLHVWQAPPGAQARYQNPAAFPFSIRLRGFLVTSDWTESEGTSTPIHAMESAERAARTFAEAILADLPALRPEGR